LFVCLFPGVVAGGSAAGAQAGQVSQLTAGGEAGAEVSDVWCVCMYMCVCV